MSAVTTGATDTSPTTRYAHNALGQRVFKTEALYPPSEGDEQDPGFFQSLIAFFTKMWGPSTSEAEKQGYAFIYDENSSLLAETGTGGANSTGSTNYIYLPTANGPMPVAVVINGELFAVHSDNLNTPRWLTNSQGQPVWQWAYSAFGENQPTTVANRFADRELTPRTATTSIAEPEFNLAFQGMYRDRESKLLYNGFRSYCPDCGGRYTQPDPAGLAGGTNRHIYAAANALKYTDPFGLFIGPWHTYFSNSAMQQMGYSERVAWRAAGFSTGADWIGGSQSPVNSHWHAMCNSGWGAEDCKKRYEDFIDQQLANCTMQGLGRAMHAAQDSVARGHKDWQVWTGGLPSREHIDGDANPSSDEQAAAISKSKDIIRRFKASCPCTTLTPTSN